MFCVNFSRNNFVGGWTDLISFTPFTLKDADMIFGQVNFEAIEATHFERKKIAL